MAEQEPAPGEIQATEQDGGHLVLVWTGLMWQPVAGGAGPLPAGATQSILEAIAHATPQLGRSADEIAQAYSAALGPGR